MFLEIIQTFICLVFVHITADFTFQTERQAVHKSKKFPFPGVSWRWWLFSHATTQSFFTLLATGSLWLSIINLFSHIIIDREKCENNINLITDQICHLFIYLAIAYMWIVYYGNSGLLQFVRW